MRKEARYILGLGACSLWLFLAAPVSAKTVVHTDPGTATIRLAATQAEA